MALRQATRRNSGLALGHFDPQTFLRSETLSEKGTEVFSSVPFESKWLPGQNDLRTIDAVISIGYERIVKKKSVIKKKVVNGPKNHVIHKAVLWRKMLDSGVVNSMSEIAKKEGLTTARVTQITNLLKLPAEMREFRLGLEDPKEIRRYSERRLRSTKP